MSTKTRPACKVRAGDVIDFGGQPATVLRVHTETNGERHLLFSLHRPGEPDGEMYVAGDLPLNVQRVKADADPEPTIKDAAPEPRRVYTFGTFPGPMPSAGEINAALKRALDELVADRQ